MNEVVGMNFPSVRAPVLNLLGAIVVMLVLLLGLGRASLVVSRARTPPTAAVTRRDCIDAGFSGLIASSWLLPTAAHASDADEVEAVLANVEWEEANPFTREDFRRLDETNDANFYSEPRFVYHIDDAAVAATTAFYGRIFESLRNDNRPLDVLDLCSSWVSHYPTGGSVPLGRVEGLGMNAEELKANPQLTGYTVRDLNKDPILPYSDASFDAITCTVSIDYLTRPLEVMREAVRLLRPGGVLAITFSNRLFFSKAVARWTGKDDLEHVCSGARTRQAHASRIDQG